MLRIWRRCSVVYILHCHTVSCQRELHNELLLHTCLPGHALLWNLISGLGCISWQAYFQSPVVHGMQSVARVATMATYADSDSVYTVRTVNNIIWNCLQTSPCHITLFLQTQMPHLSMEFGHGAARELLSLGQVSSSSQTGRGGWGGLASVHDSNTQWRATWKRLNVTHGHQHYQQDI